MFENGIINKYDINDKLYVYNSKENKIDIIKVFAITLSEDDNEVKYNYRYYEHEVFAIYDDAFTYARCYLSKVFNDLYENLKSKMKEGDSNANG